MTISPLIGLVRVLKRTPEAFHAIYPIQARVYVPSITIMGVCGVTQPWNHAGQSEIVPLEFQPSPVRYFSRIQTYAYPRSPDQCSETVIRLLHACIEISPLTQKQIELLRVIHFQSTIDLQTMIGWI